MARRMSEQFGNIGFGQVQNAAGFRAGRFPFCGPLRLSHRSSFSARKLLACTDSVDWSEH